MKPAYNEHKYALYVLSVSCGDEFQFKVTPKPWIKFFGRKKWDSFKTFFHYRSACLKLWEKPRCNKSKNPIMKIGMKEKLRNKVFPWEKVFAKWKYFFRIIKKIYLITPKWMARKARHIVWLPFTLLFPPLRTKRAFSVIAYSTKSTNVFHAF